jgi:hypothetical protein
MAMADLIFAGLGIALILLTALYAFALDHV